MLAASRPPKSKMAQVHSLIPSSRETRVLDFIPPIVTIMKLDIQPLDEGDE
jgi:hypothetical protein